MSDADYIRRRRRRTHLVRQLFMEAKHHAQTGEVSPYMLALTGGVEGAERTVVQTYGEFYSRALAERYIAESGAVNVATIARRAEQHAIADSAEWRAKYDTLAFRRLDETLAPTPEAWFAALPEGTSTHDFARLLEGLTRVSIEYIERRLAEEEERSEALQAEIAKEREAREQAEREVEEAKERADKAERKRLPALRQGLGFLKATTTREEHVISAKRKMEVRGHAVADAEARQLFKYQPLGWAELLVVHSLAAIAREAGLLEENPSARTMRPDVSAPMWRARVPFPGVAEIARVAGFQHGKQNRIDKDTRETITRALVSLTTETRWIAEPVRVKIGKEWVDDVRVTQTVWVEASTTVLTAQTALDLHPVAFASHLSAYMPADNLAARYTAARKAIGRTKMLDEYALCDNYLRYLASVEMGNVRGRAQKEAREEGGAPRAVKDAGRTATKEVAAGDVVFPRRLNDSTLREALGMTRVARDRGESAARQRVEDSLAFAQAMGTVRRFTRVDRKDGVLWDIELTPPPMQAGTTDPDQFLLLEPDDAF